MSSQRNFYEILKSTSNATFEELKRNYKQLILQYHPDKLQQDKLEEATTANVDVAVAVAVAVAVDPNVLLAHDNLEFVIINEAWNTLKDPIKRKLYDSELLLTKFQAHCNIFEHLTLNDMEEHRATTLNANNDDDGDDEYDEKKIQDTTATFFAYNCRCGGQYIIDESTATDNGIYKSQPKAADSHSNSGLTAYNKDNDCTNACQDFVTDDVDVEVDVHVDVDVDENKGADIKDDCEVMVECSECSLVIMLSNVKPSSTSS